MYKGENRGVKCRVEVYVLDHIRGLKTPQPPPPKPPQLNITSMLPKS